MASKKQLEQSPHADESVRQKLPQGVKLIKSLRGHTDIVGRIAWSPDGKLLASPSLDKTVRIWDYQTGDCDRVIATAETGVFGLAWSKNGKELVFGDDDGLIFRHEMSSSITQRMRDEHEARVESLAWSPTQDKFASASADSFVGLWSASTGRRFRALLKQSAWVNSVSWSPDGLRLVAGDEAKQLIIWDAEKAKPLHRMLGHRDWIADAEWNQEGTLIASGSNDETICIWDANKGTLVRSLEGHNGHIRRVTFSPDGRFLASKAKDSTIRIWDCATYNCVAVINEQTSKGIGPTPGLAFHPTLPLLAVVGSDPGSATDLVIRILELDVAILLGELRESIDYQTANVTIVGDSGVGKTSLVNRLTTDKYSSHSSNTRTPKVSRLVTDQSHGLVREILLWDVSHQMLDLHVESLDYPPGPVALVLVDTQQHDMSRTVESWANQIDRNRPRSGEPIVKFLVLTRADRAPIRVSTFELDSLVKRFGFAGWFNTSAYTGLSMSELMRAIQAAIPWAALPVISTSSRLKKVRDFLVERILTTDGLRFDEAGKLRRLFIDLNKEDVSEAEFLAVWGRLGAAGFNQLGTNYISAKVVIVGESNVGKSYLAHRIATGKPPREGTINTTHGMKFWPTEAKQLSPSTPVPPGQHREVVLWDMGGQEEYRLIHQLFLHDTTVALVLLDPMRGNNALNEVEAWIKSLDKQFRGHEVVKLLVGAKMDDSSGGIDRLGIERLLKDGRFSGFFETSAINGRGMADLCEAIARSINWGALGKSTRPELFQAIRNEIDKRKKQGVIVVLFEDLNQELQINEESETYPLMAHEVAMASDADAGTQALEAVCRKLAQQGMLARATTNTGKDALILRIEEVERYAGSLILAARSSQNDRGVPALELRTIAQARFHFPKISKTERLPREQEKTVVDCTVQLLLKHGICFQHEGLLIFPSLFTATSATNLANDTLPHAVSLYYDFAGAIDNIHASLIAWLVLAKEFGKVRLWFDRAEFEVKGGGLCGLRKVSRPAGFAHVDIYFGEGTPRKQRMEFISFVEDHLSRNGVEIKEQIVVPCPRGFVFDQDTLRIRISEGAKDVLCPRCEERHSLIEGATEARERDPKITRHTLALRTRIEELRDKVTKRAVQTMIDAEETIPQDGPIRILHLSDLHFTKDTSVPARLQWLLDDLFADEGLAIKELDYLVVSGDFTDKGCLGGFDKAYEFVSGLTQAFGLSAERCIFVPGNHDLVDMREAYEWRDKSDGLKEGEWLKQGEIVLARIIEKYPLRLKPFSDSFYHKFLQRAYPLDFSAQGLAIPYWDTGIQFLTLNSGWQIDQFHRKRSGVHVESVAHAIKMAQKQEGDARKTGQLVTDRPLLRIAVWHHSVVGPDQLKDTEFLGNLQKNGVRLALHGDVHEARRDIIGHWHSNRLHILGAGSFGAAASYRPESTPRLYNVLEISRDLKSVKVHTRCQPKPDGPWKGWNEWPRPDGGEGGVPYYSVVL